MYLMQSFHFAIQVWNEPPKNHTAVKLNLVRLPHPMYPTSARLRLAHLNTSTV